MGNDSSEFDGLEDAFKQHPAVHPPAEPSAAEPVPFAGYELMEEIGRGGMGVVYRARQKNLDRQVALKMIIMRVSIGPKELARFQREAIAAARGRHEGVVQVYDAGEYCGQSYFAMEYVAGQDLEDVMQGTGLTVREAAQLVAQIARAVHHMHEKGILHRDLKPSNILVAEDGKPKVTDFGLAHLLESNERLTGTRNIMGTPHYMAPEQASEQLGPMGPWSDVHALGALLYRLLTDGPPFDGPTPLQTVLQVIKEPPSPPSASNSEVPRGLEAICMRCLEKRPQRRYQTAAALADDLDRFLADKITEAEGSGMGARLRRWVESETMLAAHMGVLGFLGMFHVLQYLFIPALAEPHDLLVAVLLGLWAGSSLGLQQVEKRLGRDRVTTLVWGVMDVVFLTTVLALVHGLSSLGMMGYPLAILITGISLDERAVKVTTLLGAAGLGVLALDAFIFHPYRLAPVDNLIIAWTIVLATGMLVVDQVRRTRALSAYHDEKLP